MITDAAPLEFARNLISDPKDWCQGSSARDSNGERVMSMSSKASKWCALGALNRFLSENTFQTFGQYNESCAVVVHQCAKALSKTSIFRNWCDDIRGSYGGFEYAIGQFNDNHNHDEVMAMFDEAIEEVRNGGK